MFGCPNVAVHYVEAVVYGGVNPFSMPKLGLLKLCFVIGPKLREKPWYYINKHTLVPISLFLIKSNNLSPRGAGFISINNCFLLIIPSVTGTFPSSFPVFAPQFWTRLTSGNCLLIHG